MLSTLRIFVGAKTVEIGSEKRIKDLVQVEDVLIGPFNLPTRATK
jgi:hypothetical protein